ncbi:matrixin family metalloprotease [Nocardioides pacificus]
MRGTITARSRAALIGSAAAAVALAGLSTTPSGLAAAPRDAAVQHAVTGSDGIERGLRVKRVAPRTLLAAPASIGTGARFTVAGTAPHAKNNRARAMRLLSKSGRRWSLVAVQRPNANGVFQFSVLAPNRAGTLVLKAVTVGARKPVSKTARVRVVEVPVPTPTPTPIPEPTPDPTPTPTPTPEPEPTPDPTPVDRLGDANDWGWLAQGYAWRAPCEPITWAYNELGSYAGSFADVQRSFERISEHTGITFEYVGPSARVPFTGDSRSASDILIGWGTEATNSSLRGSVIGIGGPSGWHSGLYNAQVLLDSDGIPFARPGHEAGWGFTWGQVMVHEILHGLNLGHARGPEQIMAPMISNDHFDFGAGDISGMKAIGEARGCLTPTG